MIFLCVLQPFVSGLTQQDCRQSECLHAGLHLIINELQSCAPDSEGSESDGEHAPEETHEASQLLVVDIRTGLSTRLDEGEDSVGDHPMNAHHAFDCSSGGYLLIGMAEAHSERTYTQQLLLYKLKAGTDGKGDSQQAPAQGAMDLHWQTHLKLRREKGQDPVRPACARSILAWLVGPREVAVIDLATQAEIKRLRVETGSITSLALSESSRYGYSCRAHMSDAMGMCRVQQASA